MFKIFKDNRLNDLIQTADDNYNDSRVSLIDSAHDLKIAELEVLRKREHLKLMKKIAEVYEATQDGD